MSIRHALYVLYCLLSPLPTGLSTVLKSQGIANALDLEEDGGRDYKKLILICVFCIV